MALLLAIQFSGDLYGRLAQTLQSRMRGVIGF
jgi:hypothetical protein